MGEPPDTQIKLTRGSTGGLTGVRRARSSCAVRQAYRNLSQGNHHVVGMPYGSGV